MRSAAKAIGKLLFLLLVALLLAPGIVPPFLDRIYYRGPVSDHFDGRRFFNPDPDAGAGSGPRNGIPILRLIRFMRGEGRAPWPKSVPVTPGRPVARVEGQALRVTWIGHSTVLIQTQGLNILTDPIWSDRTGPFALGPRRVRAPGVRFDDLPRIDAVLISHNHYDHFDVPTLRRLWARDRPLIVTGLGNDTILKAKGIPAASRDWGGRVALGHGVDVVVERVHHWDSRWMADRNRALWSGFTIRLPGGNIFFAGDTGYGDGSWVADAARDGPYRLAILPIGAFKPRAMMQPSHIGPVEAVEIFRRLGATDALAVHWGTFQLSNEALDEPRELLEATLARQGIAAARFRAGGAGVAWDVPAMAPAPGPAQSNRPSAATSASDKAMPNVSASTAR